MTRLCLREKERGGIETGLKRSFRVKKRSQGNGNMRMSFALFLR